MRGDDDQRRVRGEQRDQGPMGAAAAGVSGEDPGENSTPVYGLVVSRFSPRKPPERGPIGSPLSTSALCGICVSVCSAFRPRSRRRTVAERKKG